MSSKQWTSAQNSAIINEGGTLLVSAAAGSGKTTVLVERAVRLITTGSSPVPADRLMIATFTNAAAEVLRSRIAERLEQEVRAQPNSSFLRRQRLLLRRSFIGTIDSFCIALVKEYFGTLNIPPDISIGDAPLLLQLSQEAIEQTMEDMYQDENFSRFSALYGRAKDDRAATEFVLKLYDFTRTLPHPKKQLARFAKMYTNKVPLAESPWGKELLNYAESALTSGIKLLNSALAFVKFDEVLSAYTPMLLADLASFEAVLLHTQAKNWCGALAYFNAHNFARKPSPRGANAQDKERITVLRATIKKIFENLQKYCFACTEEEYSEDLAQSAPLIEALCRATNIYEEYFAKAKLAEKVLDFSDFEHLALQLLQNEDGTRTPVSALICRRYHTVMVDEYQDTNELQDALYQSLANAEGSNLFFVGDAKQSVYRFRKANPAIFLAKKESYTPVSKGMHPALVSLGHNFRSTPALISGVNFLFGAIMSPALGDILYDEDEKLIAGRSSSLLTAGLELHLVEDPEGLGDAAFVAHRIACMIKDGYLIEEKGIPRPCRPEDFCILLRVRKNMLEFVKALEAEGLNASADLASELLTTPEILPLTAMLCAIDNPGDDINLAAAMLGPLLSFTADDLVTLRVAQPKGSLWGALLQSNNKRIQECVAIFNFYRTLSVEISVGRLCEEITTRTAYLSAVAAMENGATRQENLHLFISWANEVSASGRGGLASFVRILQGGKSPYTSDVCALPGHVSVITIHKSKGLEFPICILADAGHGFNKTDLKQAVQMHAELGIGLSLREGSVLFPTLPILAVRQRAAQELLSEEMRILYVALTRAESLAMLSFSVKDATKYISKLAATLGSEPPDPFMLSRAGSMADWVLSAALCHPDAEPFLQLAGGIIPAQLQSEGAIDMFMHPKQQTKETLSKAYALTAIPDELLQAQIINSFAQTPPRIALAGLPVKVSVSSLAKQGGSSYLPKRPSFMYAGGLTAAEKGTAQHAFMQFANFENAQQNLQEEIMRLINEGFMLANLADKLDTSGINAFLNSPLAKRMQKAKQLFREYDFITSITARQISEDLLPPFSDEIILVQGIADAVLIKENCVEIADYKTDRNTSPEALIERYQAQLILYGKAIEKRLGLPVTQLTIWSFALNAEVEVPFLLQN